MPEQDPLIGQTLGEFKILRFVAWAWGRVNARSAQRQWEPRKHRAPYVGFRVVLAPRRVP